MIRTVLMLNPLNGDQDAVINYFYEKEVLERSGRIDGFLATELHSPLEGGPLLVTAAWEDVAAYDRWVNDPWRGQSSGWLSPLLDQDLQAKSRGAMYQLVHGVGKIPTYFK